MMQRQLITHSDSPLLVLYMGGWLTFCCLALWVVWRDRVRLAAEWRVYGRFMRVPWKVFVFCPAFLFVTFAGRFTDDETWDLVTGGGMSLLAFTTAPWCVGVAVQGILGRRPPRDLFVALVLLLFSSSWFYDGYLYLREGAYTTRWWSNLMLSPIVYLAAGVLWNLEARGRMGVRLGALRLDWPEAPADRRFLPVFVAAVPLILIAAFVLVGFVRWRIP